MQGKGVIGYGNLETGARGKSFTIGAIKRPTMAESNGRFDAVVGRVGNSVSISGKTGSAFDKL
jgi:hypothetical protein